MSYKCPFCLFPFIDPLLEESDNGIRLYRCPNPATIEEGSERPKCGKRLPLNFFDSKSFVVALTGSAGVGKTYYYLALLDQLINNQALHRLGIQGDIVGTASDKKDLYNFFEEVRKQRTILATTSIEKALRSVIDLQIYKNGKASHVYLSFFDNPGERLNDQEYVADKLSNIYKADAVLFLIEPKQISKLMRSILEHNTYLRDEDSNETLYTVLNNIIQALRQVRTPRSGAPEQGVPASIGMMNNWDRVKGKFLSAQSGGRIKIPIAISISKFDQLKKSVHVDIPFDATDFELMCIRDDKFSMEMVNGISGEIEEMITGSPNGEARVKNLLSANVKNYAYFGVKSVDVDSEGKPVTLNAQGVLLPLIWLLSKLGLY